MTLAFEGLSGMAVLTSVLGSPFGVTPSSIEGIILDFSLGSNLFRNTGFATFQFFDCVYFQCSSDLFDDLGYWVNINWSTVR